MQDTVSINEHRQRVISGILHFCIFVNCSCFLKLGNLLLIFIKCPTLYKNLDNKSYMQNSEVAQISSTVTFPRHKLHQKKPFKNLRLTRSVMFVIKDF